jgi:nucleoside-diphosphate-sugar epimerase
MKTYLVTGGSGFFGGVLKRRLLEEGHSVVSLDLHHDEDNHPNLISYKTDIRNKDRVDSVFDAHDFDGVFHIAAILAHAVKDENFLWTSNVDGTRVIADAAKHSGVSNVVFTSSNCLWGEGLGRPVTEDDPANPVELYGRSKLEGENILAEYANHFNAVSIRCPTIIDSGRLGLLTILFEFIDEGRRVWTVGGGHNRYQFIYAQDLADAAIRAITHHRSDVFNIGSDDVKSIREVYSYVIERANSKAKVAALPKNMTLFGMRLAHELRVSPLGPYHYKMIAENFVFDTKKIKNNLGWRPTLTNEEMCSAPTVITHRTVGKLKPERMCQRINKPPKWA